MFGEKNTTLVENSNGKTKKKTGFASDHSALSFYPKSKLQRWRSTDSDSNSEKPKFFIDEIAIEF